MNNYMVRHKKTNCKKCNIVLTQDNRAQRGKQKNGNPRISNMCKPCCSKKVSEWVKKNKEWYLLYQRNYQRKFYKTFPQKKLTKKDVLMIRKLREEGMPVKEIASKFEISQSRISNIIAKRAWKNI